MATVPGGRLAATLLAALMACPPAWAQAPQAGIWVADPGSGCKVWNPHPVAKESIKWTGACVDGYADGPGAVQWLAGNIQIEQDSGAWHGGKQYGAGSQVWLGGRYDGDLVDGEPSGHGVLILPSARYEGEFLNGKPNGRGMMTSAKGSFQGIWKDGCSRQGNHTLAMGVAPSACP